MLDWIKHRLGWTEVDTTAKALADVFVRHVSVQQSAKSGLVDKALSAIVAQATGEKRKHGWGGNATARLANTFGWRLVELGYSESIALPLAKKLAVQLAQKK